MAYSTKGAEVVKVLPLRRIWRASGSVPTINLRFDYLSKIKWTGLVEEMPGEVATHTPDGKPLRNRAVKISWNGHHWWCGSSTW